MKLHVHGDRHNLVFRIARNLWVKHPAFRRWLSVQGWDGYHLSVFIAK